MATPVRRSGRTSQPKKYTVDAFEAIKDLVIESSEFGSDTFEAPRSEASDDEFDEELVVAAEAEATEEEIDDDLSEGDIANTSEEEDAEEGDNIGFMNKAGSVVDVAQISASKPRQKMKTRPKVDRAVAYSLPIFNPDAKREAMGRNAYYTRSIPDKLYHQRKQDRLLYNLGPGEEDLIAHVEARERWIDDVTLPTRKKRKGGAGGLSYSPFYPTERQENEANEEMKWYYENGGQEFFAREQIFNVVDADEAEKALRESFSKSDAFAVGPIHEQKFVEGLDVFGGLNIRDAWPKSSRPAATSAWLFNSGSRVQNLEWVPNQSGLSQYLAVATAPERKPDLTKHGEGNAQAYTPIAFHHQCLQIWEFFPLPSPKNEGGKIDYSKPPVLRFVLSSEWGTLRKLAWYTTPDRAKDSIQGQLRLGLLATVWSDGRVRVLDLDLPVPTKPSTQHIHIAKAAFESKPSDTVCTSVTWLSTQAIAVGCANGAVAIWSLPETIQQLQSASSRTTPNPRPWFYQAFHQTYIKSITSGFPSRPHMLFTNSLDGNCKAIDVRAPHQDTVFSARVRVAPNAIAWHDVTQTCLTCDENFTLKGFSLRIFHKMQSVAKVSEVALDTAVSPVHPCVLVACVDGSVWCTNPMRKLRDHKIDPWVQCWFKHEWRRPVQLDPPTAGAEENVDIEMTDGDDGADGAHPHSIDDAGIDEAEERRQEILQKPMIRFTSGFKLAKSDLGSEARKNAIKNGTSLSTIYEEQTAATQVAWNPNLRAGTWAAAGMGTGLVMVQDLGYD